MKKIENYTVIPEAESQEIKVLLVDDQSFVRRFISKSLEDVAHIKIIGTADNGIRALEQLELLQPDVVLLDLEMPEMNGIEATKIIHQRFPHCQILVLSCHETHEYLQPSLAAGAKGYILKGSSAEELSQAIESVYRGYTQLSPGLLEKVLTPEVEVVSDSPEEIETSTQLAAEDWAESTRETINTIPQVSLRAILYVLLLLAGVLIPWVIMAKVDEIGSARGRLEPKNSTIRLDAPVSGTVTSIEVKEGEQIKKGESLLKLDSEIVDAQLRQQQQKLLGQQNQLNQLQLIKNQQRLSLRTQEQQNQAQELEKEALIEQAQQTLKSLKASYNIQLSEKAAQLAQAKEAIAASEAAHQMAEIRYQTAREKVPRYRKAHEQGALSRDLLAEAEQNAQESQARIKQTASEIAQARSRYNEQKNGYDKLLQQISAEINQAALRLQEQQRGLKSLVQTDKLALSQAVEEQKNTQAQIVNLEAEIAQTQSMIDSLKYQLRQHILYAPITGTIFQLSVQKPGAVLQTGQMVAQIAPEDSPLVLRGKMSSSESGFLEVGLPVKLKFDAYPFQDYGIVPGKLTWISPDSRSSQSNIANGSASPQPPGDFYEVEVTLERNYIEADNRRIVLTPGHTATAEVVIRQRRLADIFLEPFRSLKKGGVQL